MKKLLIKTVFIALFLFTGMECYLRFYWGFCDAVLAVESDTFEYIAQPLQDRFRFRKHIRYNEFSMRSEPVKESGAITILGFGDSVLNGGASTDQDSLATYIIEKELTREYKTDVQCLNISCGSWGPDNCYAYLEKYGDLGAELIFLAVSSHDAYDNMTFEKVVDKHPNYPSKQYISAIYELVDRYLIPRLQRMVKSNSNLEDPIVKGNEFNPGFSAFYRYTQEKNIPFLVYLHPDLHEIRDKKYDRQGEAVISFCTAHHIPLIQGIRFEDETLFRDKIHLNEKGQRILAHALLPEIRKRTGCLK